MARSFDGTSSTINLTAVDTAIDCYRPSGFTVMGWAKANAGFSDYHQILSHEASNIGYWFYVTAAYHPAFSFRGLGSATSTLTMSSGTWYHIAAVVTTTNVRFSMITESGTQTTDNVSNSDVVGTGTHTATNIGGGNNWAGSLGHIGVWAGAALTDAELKSVAGALGPSPKTGCNGYWALTGGSPELDQGSGANNSTSITGTTPWVADPAPTWATRAQATAAGNPGTVSTGLTSSHRSRMLVGVG